MKYILPFIGFVLGYALGDLIGCSIFLGIMGALAGLCLYLWMNQDKIYAEAEKQVLLQQELKHKELDSLLDPTWGIEIDEDFVHEIVKVNNWVEKKTAEEEVSKKIAEEEVSKKIAEEEARTKAAEEEARHRKKRESFPLLMYAFCELRVSKYWHTHSNDSISHKYFFDYHPYDANKDGASERMRYVWNLVWDFKNDEKVTPFMHSMAVDQVAELTEKALKERFGKLVQYITFVCMTASTAEKTRRRFESFSERVSKDLDMENGYGRIRITEDAVPKHEGGDGKPKKEYDTDFFRGKYVILFDDVRTTGASLREETEKLRSLGATVLGTMTIAQTRS